MTEAFDAAFWEAHWDPGADEERRRIAANPYLGSELAGLAPGTALDAGCGEGAEAIWLARRGWTVTGVDISRAALQSARNRAAESGADVEWIDADLGVWRPAAQYDLVTTFYAHPTIPQLDFYARIGEWVRPGGTLLIVGHLHTDSAHHHGTPAHASVRAETVVGKFPESVWRVETAEERGRLVEDPFGYTVALADVVVRATRRAV